MAWIRRNWEVVVAVTVTWAVCAIFLARAIAACDGHFVYGLDDPYIHMATARNLVEHGIWGVTRYGFSSSQSSLLWPLLLALMYLPAGPFALAPLLLNLGSATAMVAYLVIALKRFGLSGGLTLLITLLAVLIMPLPVIVLFGIEHTLQAFVGLVFVDLSVRMLAGAPPPPRGARALVVLAPVLVAVRFEGLFLIAIVAALLAARRRWRPAVAMIALAALPIVVYGAISVAHGAFWLPNSVLLKSNTMGLNGLGEQFKQLLTSAIICLLVPAAILYRVRRRKGLGDPGQLALLIFGAACVLQVIFAAVMVRYEAHLVVLGFYALGVALHAVARESADLSEGVRRWLPAAVILVVVAAPLPQPGGLKPPLGYRNAVQALTAGHLTACNIYQQQYQMGRFLRQYYTGQGVAANDIGAIDYMADIRLLDLWGLADNDVARARIGHAYTTETIRRIARRQHVRIAVAYPEWFDGEFLPRLPAEWPMVAMMDIPGNLVAGKSTVAFWAVDPAETPRLRRNLLEFFPRLPEPVRRRLLPPYDDAARATDGSRDARRGHLG